MSLDEYLFNNCFKRLNLAWQFRFTVPWQFVSLSSCTRQFP